MEKLKKHIHDDSNGLDYVLVGDTIFQTYSCRRKAAQSDGGDGCTGNICKSIVPTGTMNCFCLESCGHILPILDEQAQNRLDCIIAQIKETEGVTEELKAKDQLAWVGHMNSIRHRAEEVIRSEMIFV